MVREREGRGAASERSPSSVSFAIDAVVMNVRDVTPPLIRAKPPVGSVAGTPIVKFAADTGESWPSSTSPA